MTRAGWFEIVKLVSALVFVAALVTNHETTANVGAGFFGGWSLAGALLLGRGR